MSGYITEVKSRAEIRRIAKSLRKKLRYENQLWIPVISVLDLLCDLYPDFSYEIVPDTECEECYHAFTDVDRKKVIIKESVYNGAANGNGRDRMTIAHELGHYIMLCEQKFKLILNSKGAQIPAYQSPEWQAKCFAGELLIDSKLAEDLTPIQIMEGCGVSLQAADYQYNIMHSKFKRLSA